MQLNTITVISVSANDRTAALLAKELGAKHMYAKVYQYLDGEQYVEPIVEEQVAIVFDYHPSRNADIQLLLKVIRACRYTPLGAVPLLPYSRGDTTFFLDLLAACGIQRVVTIDVHDPAMTVLSTLVEEWLYPRKHIKSSCRQ